MKGSCKNRCKIRKFVAQLFTSKFAYAMAEQNPAFWPSKLNSTVHGRKEKPRFSTFTSMRC